MADKQPSSKPVLDKQHCLALVGDFPICDYTVATWGMYWYLLVFEMSFETYLPRIVLIGFTVAFFLWYVICGIPLLRRLCRWRARRQAKKNLLDPLDPEKAETYEDASKITRF